MSIYPKVFISEKSEKKKRIFKAKTFGPSIEKYSTISPTKLALYILINRKIHNPLKEKIEYFNGNIYIRPIPCITS